MIDSRHPIDRTSWLSSTTCSVRREPPTSTLFPYTTLFRSEVALIESQQKKVAFLREVIRTLALEGVRVHAGRSEEHTSELQSRRDLVCRLLLEKKNDSKNLPDRLCLGGAAHRNAAPRTRRD